MILVLWTVPLKGTVGFQLLLFPYARISTRSSARCHSAYQPWTAIYRITVQNVYFILMNWLTQIFTYSNKRLTDTTDFYFFFLAADIEFLHVVYSSILAYLKCQSTKITVEYLQNNTKIKVSCYIFVETITSVRPSLSPLCCSFILPWGHTHMLLWALKLTFKSKMKD